MPNGHKHHIYTDSNAAHAPVTQVEMELGGLALVPTGDFQSSTGGKGGDESPGCTTDTQ